MPKLFYMEFSCSDCTTATLEGTRSVASSCGFSETDETMTAETITPNQLTLQALTSDEEDFDVADIEKDVQTSCTGMGMSQVWVPNVRANKDDVSLSSGNESGNSVPVEGSIKAAGNSSLC